MPDRSKCCKKEKEEGMINHQGATGLDLVISLGISSCDPVSGLELIILIRHVNGPSEKKDKMFKIRISMYKSQV